jgi:excisionase family DNA binding protein
MHDDFMTAAEVAAELRLHPVTVQKFCRDGKLPCSRVGRSYRIPRAAFEEFKRGAAVEAKVVSIETTLEPELSSLVKAWLHHLEHGPKPCAHETIKTHRRHFFRYARGLLGMDPNAKLTFQEVATERALLKVLTRIPVAQFATRYNLFMAVMSFTSFLLKQGLMDEDERNRMKRHKPKRLAPAKRTVLNSIDEVNKLFDALWYAEAGTLYDKTLNAAALGVMVFAGLRASEVARLEVADVDLVNRILYVNHGKGGKSRMVGITTRLTLLRDQP